MNISTGNANKRNSARSTTAETSNGTCICMNIIVVAEKIFQVFKF
jgi:hypothetical protein